MTNADSFITKLEDITPARLTTLLRHSSTLDAASQVTAVQIIRDLTPPMSNLICVLELTYSEDAPFHLPTRMVLKNGRMMGEVTFYNWVYPTLNYPAVLKNYGATFENDLGQSNLLLEDLSATHQFFEATDPAIAAHLPNLITTLAAMHRLGWNHPELMPQGKIGGHELNMPTKLAFPRAQQGLASFFNALGADLTPQHKEYYQKIFQHWPLAPWAQRCAELKNVTVVHGDVHWGNVAIPTTPHYTPRLLDWSLWHINLPTYDLTYLLALRTSPALRAQYERTWLQQYHTQLGIAGYSFENLLADYRLLIPFQAVWPVFFHTFTPPIIWQQLHQQIMQAFEDWQCAELF